jgi:PAS domain S-box-containing protein
VAIAITDKHASGMRDVSGALALVAVLVAYYVTGRLGLELAIPPGYATAIWPPSGIALASVLLFGPRVWPAIAAGSFLINVATGFDASTTWKLAGSIAVPAAIAGGAALQALVGASLVRRWDRPNALSDPGIIVRFFFFGGCVACVVNPSIGVGILYATGLVPASNVAFSWITWWVGDTIGVFVFAPLAIAWLDRPRPQWAKRSLPVTLCLAATFGLTVLLVYYTTTLERASFSSQFRQKSADLAEELSKATGTYHGVVDLTAAAQAVAGVQTEERFKALASRVRLHVPGIQAMEWLPRIGAGERDSFESAQRASGRPEFEIKERNGDTLVRAGARAEYFPVMFVEPLSGNEQAVGYDVGSEPSRRRTLLAAQDTGLPTVSDPVRLIQGGLAFLMVSPAYRGLEVPATQERRRQDLIGYSVGLVRFAELIAAAFNGYDLSEIDFWLTDASTPSGPVLLASNNAAAAGPMQLRERGLFGSNVDLGSRVDIDFGGRLWVLQTSPTQMFAARYRSQSSWVVLVVGMLFTGLLGAFIMVITGREESLRVLVDQRTAEVREAEQRFRLLINGVRDHAIYMLDPRGYVASWNSGAAETKGYAESEIVGRHFSIFYTQKDRDAGFPAYALAEAEHSGKFSQEGWRVRKGGPRFWAHVTIEPIRGEAGQLLGFAKVTRDISKARATADALEAAKLNAENANRAKSNFLASMSHEIRTPMNGILGFADIVLDGSLGETQRRYLNMLKDAGKSLLAIINDILDLSKIEAGKLELEIIQFSPASVADAALSIVRPFAQEKGIELRASLPPDLPSWLAGDPVRLRQILLNFLNNAVKFTNCGHVELTVRSERVAGRQARYRLHLAVTDTGVGIPPELQHLLFQQFSQIDRSTSRQFGGTGLGLAISKRLVEAMGGEIGVESRPGEGSTFWFAVELFEASPPASVEPASMRRVRVPRQVLVAEDLAMNQVIVEAMLASGGHLVTLVGNGAEALAAHEAGSFDIVLMDIEMPVMNGVEATKAIRRMDGPKGRIPIVALTANVMVDEVARFRAAGASEHLAKPIDRDALLDLIDRLTSASSAAAKAIAEPAAVPIIDERIFSSLGKTVGSAQMTRFAGMFRTHVRATLDASNGHGDRHRLAGEAHKLVSIAGNLGFSELVLRSRALMYAAKDDGKDVAGEIASFQAAAERAMATMADRYP